MTDSPNLADLLRLTETTPTPHGDRRTFSGRTQWCPWPKAYGGDMVAQASVAAMRTVDPARQLHSMHSYFMRPVDVEAEVTYEVEILRDGRGFSTRQVRALQNSKTAYVAMASFHVPEAGGGFQVPAPAEATAPSELLSSEEYLRTLPPEQPTGTMTAESDAYWRTGRGFDMRHSPGPVYVKVVGGDEPRQRIWIKPFDALPLVDGLTQDQVAAAALAYVCDYTILEPVLRVLGHAWSDPGLVTASLDHAMWFHRPAVFDDWLLYAQEAGAAGDGRGLGMGRFFSSSGALLATVAQEGLVRAGRKNP